MGSGGFTFEFCCPEEYALQKEKEDEEKEMPPEVRAWNRGMKRINQFRKEFPGLLGDSDESKRGNPQCWVDPGYNTETCCDFHTDPDVRQGNIACWDTVYNYEVCCEYQPNLSKDERALDQLKKF